MATWLGVSFRRLTHITLSRSHPDLLRVWRQSVRAETKDFGLTFVNRSQINKTRINCWLWFAISTPP